MEVEVVQARGSVGAPDELQLQKLHVYHALHAIHMDYIMRAHVTHWYGPSADHPGGWCGCYKGEHVQLQPRVARQTGVRTTAVYGSVHSCN